MNESTESIWMIPIAIVGFLVIFPLFWSAISRLLAGMSGWSRLAARYGWQGEMPASCVTTSARIGLVNYNGVLIIGQENSFVYLSVVRLFPFHPTLRIPLGDITVSGPNRLLFLRYMELTVNDGPTIRLPASAWEDTVGRH